MFRELLIPSAILCALTSGVAQTSEPAAFPWQCWRTGEGPYPSAQGGLHSRRVGSAESKPRCLGPNTAGKTRNHRSLVVACANGEVLIACPALKVAAKPKSAPQAQRCGSLFGHPPNDGLGQPINELFCDIRGAVFCHLILPGLCT